MTLGPDERLYLICGEFQDVCKLYQLRPHRPRGISRLGRTGGGPQPVLR